MRSQLLILLAALDLFTYATAKAATPAAATVSSSEAAETDQAATWTPRKLLNFSSDRPNLVPSAGVTCDLHKGEVRLMLLALGARASDLNLEPHTCGFSVTFSVLVPADITGKNPADAVVDARWQTVELRTGTVDAFGKLGPFRNSPTRREEGTYDRTCDSLKLVTEKILPLFSAREVKLIPKAVCEKYGVGLHAQVLKPTQELAASP